MFWTKFELLFLEICEKTVCSTLGTLGQLYYTIIVFQFDFFPLDFNVDIGLKHHLFSLYTHGRTWNIFCPTFWQDFHIFCILAITTAVGTTSQSRSIRLNVLFKAVEPSIHLDWGCLTIKTLTTGCPKQYQFPLQHMWGSARLCKRQAATILPSKLHS